MTPLKKFILVLILVLLVCTPAVSALRLDFTRIGYSHPRPGETPNNNQNIPDLHTFKERLKWVHAAVDLTYSELTHAMKPNIYLYSDQDLNARVRADTGNCHHGIRPCVSAR